MSSSHHIVRAILAKAQLAAFTSGLMLGAAGGATLAGSIVSAGPTETAAALAPPSIDDQLDARSPGGRPPGASSNKLPLSVYAPTAAVPEPETWMMMIFGFGTVGAQLRRDRAVKRRSARPSSLG